MARGRMISKALSTSEKWAALHETAGKLAEFCQALYPLLLAHTDDWGVIPGDPFTVKHLVNPTSPRRLPDFRSALVALHNVGLITWYLHEDKWWIYIVGFSAHQKLHGNDRRPRTSPPPPENPSVFDDSATSGYELLKPALRELKGREEKRREPVRSDADAPTAGAEDEPETGPPPKVDVGGFIRTFCELYAKHRHGTKYHVIAQKDVPRIRSLLTTYGADDLKRMALVLLTTDDTWIAETDRGIGILSTKASKLASVVAAHRARQGVAGCATTAAARE